MIPPIRIGKRYTENMDILLQLSYIIPNKAAEKNRAYGNDMKLSKRKQV